MAYPFWIPDDNVKALKHKQILFKEVKLWDISHHSLLFQVVKLARGQIKGTLQKIPVLTCFLSVGTYVDRSGCVLWECNTVK